MSQKNHEITDGRLVQTDKKYSHLKLKQKEKIAEWMFVALLCFTIIAIFIVNNKATISVSYNADGIVEIC